VYNIPPLIPISPLESPSSLECEEKKRFETRIGTTFELEKTFRIHLRQVLECLKRGILSKKSGLAIGPNVTMEKLIMFLNSNEENDKKRIGEVQQLTIEPLEA